MEKKCENCKYESFYENVEYCKDCSIDADKFLPKPQTNRQWLESLSDEELARRIDILRGCDSCIYNEDGKSMFCNHTDDCREGIIKWLQAEHKE